MKTLYKQLSAGLLFLLFAHLPAFAGGIAVAIMQQNNCTCNGACNGAATAQATGGIGPYSYVWSPSGGNQQSAVGLCAGTYTVTATDQNSQVGTTTVTITEPGPVVATAVAQFQPCTVTCTGSATAFATNGVGPYTYTWMPGNLSGQTQSGVLCPGSTYTVTATDANGCTGSYVLTTPPQSAGPSITVSTTNTSSQQTCDGTATANVSGGVAPYSYMWTPGGQTTASISNLCQGSYNCCVTDANGCTSCQQINITFSTGISDPSAMNGISIFPNPANTSFVVHYSAPVSKIELYELTGRLVTSVVPADKNTEQQLSVSSLPEGLYMLRVYSASGVSTRRITVLH